MSCGWNREVQTRADAVLDALEERTNSTQSQGSAATGTLLSYSMCWWRGFHEVAVHELTTKAPTASVTPSITYLEAFRRERPPCICSVCNTSIDWEAPPGPAIKPSAPSRSDAKGRNVSRRMLCQNQIFGPRVSGRLLPVKHNRQRAATFSLTTALSSKLRTEPRMRQSNFSVARRKCMGILI